MILSMADALVFILLSAAQPHEPTDSTGAPLQHDTSADDEAVQQHVAGDVQSPTDSYQPTTSSEPTVAQCETRLTGRRRVLLARSTTTAETYVGTATTQPLELQ